MKRKATHMGGFFGRVLSRSRIRKEEEVAGVRDVTKEEDRALNAGELFARVSRDRQKERNGKQYDLVDEARKF